jgi:hypothetical protein
MTVIETRIEVVEAGAWTCVEKGKRALSVHAEIFLFFIGL